MMSVDLGSGILCLEVRGTAFLQFLNFPDVLNTCNNTGTKHSLLGFVQYRQA